MKRVIKTVLLELWVSPQLIISYLIYLFFKLCGVVNETINISDRFKLIYIDMSKRRFAGGHPDHNWHDELPNSTTAMIFTFSDNAHLYFNDLRKFGWCKVLSDQELKNIFAFYSD